MPNGMRYNDDGYDMMIVSWLRISKNKKVARAQAPKDHREQRAPGHRRGDTQGVYS